MQHCIDIVEKVFGNYLLAQRLLNLLYYLGIDIGNTLLNT